MMIALFPHPTHPDSKKLCEQIIGFFKQHGITVVAEDKSARELNLPPLSSVNPDKIKFLISMGGDGTILRLAHTYDHLQAAIFGINLGHLGFMADVPIVDLLPSLEDLLKGAYTIENRLVIEGTAPDGSSFYALNDFVLHRTPNPSLIQLSIYLDDLYLNTFEADGIIIATPNGSTAYSLASGGPILSPGLDGIVITPICPHTISNRPIVLTSSHEIRVEYLSHYPKIEVVVDGLSTVHLTPNTSFKFKKSSKTFRLVNLNRRDYYSTLRTKLGWSGKLRR
jgi:NAD+ kinase